MKKDFLHNDAEPSDVAKTVLMPGDPLRAKKMAEHFLTDCKQITTQRNMFGYTGFYKQKRVTFMGSGMGMPSIGIYSYELFSKLGVERIIRVGTCKAMNCLEEYKDVSLGSVIVATSSFSYSNYNFELTGDQNKTLLVKKALLDEVRAVAHEQDYKVHFAPNFSSDCFYSGNPQIKKDLLEKKILAVEMETFALLSNAQKLNKEALGIYTVSDTEADPDDFLSAEERETTCYKMFELALNLIKE